uniref:Putative disease resistance protein n=1 Tax=Noccaea caerulescens TaxID=107243 RepID=A0A1J3HHA4_NOCCA
MGGCGSVAISCDGAVNSLTSCVSGEKNPFLNLVDHVATLRKTARQLEARRDDLIKRIRVQEDRGLSRFSEVQEWLSEVEITVREAQNLLLQSDDEMDKLCCHQYCSKSCKSSYDYSSEIVTKLKDVERLISRGAFDEVAQKGPVPKVEERLFHQKIVGQQALVESTWDIIKEESVGILGIYGMGGVGKTTFLSQINNKFLTESNEFDIVIWAVVSKNPTVKRIQEEIGKRLDLYDEGWERKTENEIASVIKRSLENKKFVLLLDDLWTRVDLANIGIPVLEKNKSLIAFTTRSIEVCGRMRAEKEIEVECLMWDDAWELFTKNMKETLESHPGIPEVAESIARKCYGLPLALNVIGETMARKNAIEEWRAAARELSSYAPQFLRIEADILSILKFSYDDLKCEKTKSCFLFCALFPKDYEIGKDDLIEYWVSQNIIPGSKGINYNGYAIMGTLIRAYLLKESESKDSVKMHDVVREMALWISSGCGDQQQENVVVVEANAQLREFPNIKDRMSVRKMSLIYNQIEEACESLRCPNLETLLLRDNRLRSISSEFFSQVPALAVLDLSLNPNLVELPNLSNLISLRHLNLSCTGITSLPHGLRKLIYLNLEHTYMLKSIDGEYLSPKLQVLRLYASGIDTSDELVKKIQAMKHLYLLTITLRNSSGLESFLLDKKLAGYNEGLDLNQQSIKNSLRVPLATISSSRFLEIQDSHIAKIEVEESSSNQSGIVGPRARRDICFINLRKVRLDNCTGLKDLTWLLLAPHVATLSVVMLPNIEHIINTYEATMLGRTCDISGIIPFRELETLTLWNLGELKSIYWEPLLFGKLKEINIKSCPELSKLPLNSTSAWKQNVVIKAEEEWLRGIEWEDEATKQRFFPS